MQLEMARSSFSVSEVCQIVCEDGDEEYIFSGSDDDLGMDDLEDDNLDGESEFEQSLSQMQGPDSGSLPANDESGEQSGPLPASHSSPSGASSPLQSPPLTPASPPPLSRTRSLRRRRQQCPDPLPTPTPSVPPPKTRRRRAQPNSPVPSPSPQSRRAQPRRPAGEESSNQWSKEPTDVVVQPFVMDVGPTFHLSADPMEVFITLFTPELIDLIVRETNRYAALCLAANTARPVRSWETNADEMKAYLGFNILMGMNRLPELYDLVAR